MAYFRPKRGPVFSLGRFSHAAIGILVPCVAYRLWGYNALGWATVGTLLGACAWEIATVRLGKILSWSHRYGDVVDLLAFVLGVLVGASVALGLGS